MTERFLYIVSGTLLDKLFFSMVSATYDEGLYQVFQEIFACQIMQLKLPRCPNWDMVLAKNGLREEKSVGFSVSSWKYSDDFAVI